MMRLPILLVISTLFCTPLVWANTSQIIKQETAQQTTIKAIGDLVRKNDTLELKAVAKALGEPRMQGGAPSENHHIQLITDPAHPLEKIIYIYDMQMDKSTSFRAVTSGVFVFRQPCPDVAVFEKALNAPARKTLIPPMPSMNGISSGELSVRYYFALTADKWLSFNPTLCELSY